MTRISERTRIPIRDTDTARPETAVTPDPQPTDTTEEGRDRVAKSRRLKGLWERAFGNAAPGGASCTQSPTLGRSLGSSAPGVAEEGARREGTPDQNTGADRGPDPDQLTAVQLAVLTAAHADQHPDTGPTNASTQTETVTAGQAPDPAADGAVQQTAAAFVHANVPALDVPPLKVHPKAQAMPKGKIRRFTGKRRRVRVGPVGFTEAEHTELLAAAERHGYGDTVSGYLADIALAFIRGAFTVDLPLHSQRQEVQEFRAKIRYEINRIGVNINQMVYVLHRDDRIEPDVRERLERLDRILTHIARALLLPTEAADTVEVVEEVGA